MTRHITSFAELIAPLGAEEFLNDYHDRRWVHLEGAPERFADLMSWADLNRLLDMRVWTGRTFQMALDRQRVPAEAYCDPGVDRSHQQGLLPNARKVQELLQRGASLVLNEVETLHPRIQDVVAFLEQTLGAKSSANIYVSWQAHQAFDAHYDRHDVFALHVHGEKTWNIYQGRAEHPIEHPAFHNIPQSEYDRMKRGIDQQVTMRPGDLLYLPCGQFHDALAQSGASIHVTFSCSEPNGLDWLNALWQQAVFDPAFRAYMPRARGAGGEVELRAYIETLLNRLGGMALAPEALQRLQAMRQNFGMSQPRYDLPDRDRPAGRAKERDGRV